jgi:hypothetical protein
MRSLRTSGTSCIHKPFGNPRGGDDGQTQQCGWNADYTDPEDLLIRAGRRSDEPDDKEEIEQNSEGEYCLTDEVNTAKAFVGSHGRYSGTDLRLGVRWPMRMHEPFDDPRDQKDRRAGHRKTHAEG